MNLMISQKKIIVYPPVVLPLALVCRYIVYPEQMCSYHYAYVMHRDSYVFLHYLSYALLPLLTRVLLVYIN